MALLAMLVLLTNDLVHICQRIASLYQLESLKRGAAISTPKKRGNGMNEELRLLRKALAAQTTATKALAAILEDALEQKQLLQSIDASLKALVEYLTKSPAPDPDDATGIAVTKVP